MTDHVYNGEDYLIEIMALLREKPITAFETTMYTVGNNKIQSEQLLAQLQQSVEFKQVHKKNCSKKEKLKEWDLVSKICIAAKKKSNSIDLLINKGADFTIADNTGKTPLDIIIKNNNLRILKLIVRQCDDLKKIPIS